MGRELRRTYLIKRSFQSKLILRLSLMILVTSLMVALIFIGSRFYVAAQLGEPDHFDVIDELGSIFFEVLVYWLAGYLVLFAYFALRFSHEIAGPLYRLEKSLTELAEDGGLERPVRLREEDDREYHQLGDLVNRAGERMQRMTDAIREAAAVLEELSAARDGHPSERLDRVRAGLVAATTLQPGHSGTDEEQQRLPAADGPESQDR